MRKLAFVFLLCSSLYGQQSAQKTIGTIHHHNPLADALIPKDTRIEVLAQGFEWSEGPVWVKKGGYLLFNDIPQNTTWKWHETQGLSIFLRPAGYAIGTQPPGKELGSNGLAVHPQTGRIIFCDHGNRCLAELDQEFWVKRILVSQYNGKRLNSPNDLVISSGGQIYFTDPPYGLKRPDYPGKELEFNGVFHLTPKGELSLVTTELDRPNGIALSPDEQTLYVANSGKKKIWVAFDIAENGTAINGRLFFDATSLSEQGKRGGCDGLAVDNQGNLWATGPGGVLVITPDARHIATIETGVATANCCFGGDNGNELYITADMYLCRVKLNAKGTEF
jgi:gluconolactonase